MPNFRFAKLAPKPCSRWPTPWWKWSTCLPIIVLRYPHSEIHLMYILYIVYYIYIRIYDMYIQLSYSIYTYHIQLKTNNNPTPIVIVIWYANFCQKCPLSAGLKFQHHLLLLLFQVASPLFHPPAQSTLTSSLDDGTSNNDDLTSKNGDLTRKKMCVSICFTCKNRTYITSKHEDLTSKRGLTVLHQNGEYSNLWPFNQLLKKISLGNTLTYGHSIAKKNIVTMGYCGSWVWDRHWQTPYLNIPRSINSARCSKIISNWFRLEDT